MDGSERLRDRNRVFLMLAVGLVIRLVWWWTHALVIENEGAEYARIADNWLAGDGYVGLFGGRNVVFPPLYPGLIALASLVVGDAEIAARVVSLLAGLALIAGSYGVGREAFGEWTGRLAGWLTAIHPLAVALSVSAYSEGLAMALTVLAIYVTLRCLRTWTSWRAVVAGALVGLAYLTRPETLVFAFVLAVVLGIAHAVMQRRGTVPAIRAGSLVLAGAFVVAAPYAASLSLTAGSFRLEGKSAIVGLINARMRGGMSFPEAARGLTLDDAGWRGPFLTADQSLFLKTASPAGSDLIASTLASAPDRAWAAARALRYQSSGFFGIATVALAIFGLLAHQWWMRTRPGALVLTALMAVQAMFLLAVEYPWDRYFFPLLPFVIAFAAVGIERVCALSTKLLAAWFTDPQVRTLGATAGLLLVVLAAAPIYSRVANLGEFAQARDLPTRLAGEWIREQAVRSGGEPRPLVMGYGSAIAFYADAVLSYLPYVEESSALRYIEEEAPRFIVIRSSELEQAPYFGRWLEAGISHPCAAPVTEQVSHAWTGVRIWRWLCPPTHVPRS